MNKFWNDNHSLSNVVVYLVFSVVLQMIFLKHLSEVVLVIQDVIVWVGMVVVLLRMLVNEQRMGNSLVLPIIITVTTIIMVSELMWLNAFGARL